MTSNIFYRPQRSWGKAIFSQASVILSTGGACMAGGTCVARGWGCAWPGGIHGWGAVHGRGHA